MNTPDAGEVTVLVPRPGVLRSVPDNRQRYQKKLAVYIILASVLFERLAFYSLGDNLVVYLGSAHFQWTPTTSATAVYIFYGTTYISTLLFAIISDAKFGRATTIIIGFIIYLIGYVLFTLNATEPATLCPSKKSGYLVGTSIGDQYCAIPILGTLICIAIGAGAVQSNMAVFGAEQIQKSKITSRYFDKYMVAVNIGAIIATSAIPYMQNRKESYYLVGFIVSASMLLVPTLLFLIGRPFYINVDSDETIVTKCIPVTINAFQSWLQYRRDRHSIDEQQQNSTTPNLIGNSDDVTKIEESMTLDEQSLTFLDYAKAAYKGKFQDRIVNDVKSLRGALIVFLLLIPYWLIYNQPDATFPSQGKQMSGNNLEVVITWMAIADPLVIIIGILIFNIFVYKHLNDQHPIMEIASKLVIGMCLASFTMCITGVIEVFRQQSCGINSGKNQSSLTVYAQLPQYIGIGLAELFATVACFEFAYYAAPRSAQSLFMSLRFCSMGISSYIGAAYIAVFPTSSFNLDFSCQSTPDLQWSFYVYFFNLAGLQLIFMIIFILCQKKFQIVKVHPDKLGLSQFL